MGGQIRESAACPVEPKRRVTDPFGAGLADDGRGKVHELRHHVIARERTLGPSHRDLAFNLTGEGDALLSLKRGAEAW